MEMIDPGPFSPWEFGSADEMEEPNWRLARTHSGEVIDGGHSNGDTFS
jgi:hypothetical protein